MLFALLYQLSVVYFTSPNYYHIVSEVVASVEIDNHVTSNAVNIVDVTKNRLAHHMLSVNVVVYIFHKSLHKVLIGSFKFLPNGFLFILQMILVIDGMS
jgi:hypothetical protein